LCQAAAALAADEVVLVGVVAILHTQVKLSLEV
jgi:hypothetical protein